MSGEEDFKGSVVIGEQGGFFICKGIPAVLAGFFSFNIAEKLSLAKCAHEERRVVLVCRRVARRGLYRQKHHKNGYRNNQYHENKSYGFHKNYRITKMNVNAMKIQVNFFEIPHGEGFLELKEKRVKPHVSGGGRGWAADCWNGHPVE